MLYRVQIKDDAYIVEADSLDEAVAQVKDSIKDEAGSLKTVEALVADEQAAVEAYRVAIENLEGKLPDESLNVLKAILKDENRHIENLQAVINGTVTEKNLEDSVKDSALETGKTYTSKSGHKITIRSVKAGFSDYDGKAWVDVTYDYVMADGKKGSSSASAKDIFTMLNN